MQFTDASTLIATPERPAAIVRMSEDGPLGVVRQTEDVTAKQHALAWGGELRVIAENDTSAYKKKTVTLADGAKVRRVVRPEFEEMIRAIYAREIDGLIVYDLDRLVRQPRQLEDLIDAVEAMRIPVVSCTAGQINLLTPDGRMAARVVCATAIKASDDTARRTARRAFQAAEEGSLKLGGPRRFGWQEDGLRLKEDEAEAIREAVRRVMSGETLWSVCTWLHEQGIRPVAPTRKANVPTGVFSRSTLNGILRSPRIAGIRVYAGVGRGRKVKVNDWRNRVATKADAYVMGPWTPIISVGEWEALQEALDAASRTTNGGHTARRYLLSGLLRCGGCGARMTGRTASVKRAAYYQCVPKDLGGCNKVTRDMAKVDARVEELLMRRLEGRALVAEAPVLGPEEIKAAKAEEKRIKASKESLRARWVAGEMPDADYYADQDALNERLRALGTHLAEKQRRRARTGDNPRDSWNKGSLAVKRAMLGEELLAITVMPQAKRGRYGWDPTEIQPSWRGET